MNKYFSRQKESNSLLTHRSYLTGVLIILGQSLLVTFALSGSVSLAGQAEEDKQQQVKIAIVFKISQFVEWPEMTLSNEQFNICVAGKEQSFLSFQALESRTLNNKPIKITYLKDIPRSEPNCQILYLPASSISINSYKKWLNTKALTISDIIGFSEQHGIIELALENERLAIKINLTNARQHDINILSPLLQLSTIVSQ